MTTRKFTAWNVYLKNHKIDTVFYLSDCDADYIKKSLIDHDGYSRSITIKKDK